MIKILKQITGKSIGLILAIILLISSVQPSYAQLIFTNDVFDNEASIFRIGEGSDASVTPLTLEFGSSNTQTFSWDNTNSWFELSGDVNLNQNELKNAVIDNLTASPISPIEGQIYYNTTDEQTYMYTSTGWEPMGYHAHTHVNGEDDIQLATSTQKGLMSPEYALELESLADESDEINRNTINVNLNLGEYVSGSIAYLTYDNPEDIYFVANIQGVEYDVPDNALPGIALVGGTDMAPILNYVYVREGISTVYVESSTTNPYGQGFEYITLAEVLLGSVGVSTATYYYIENLTNFIRNFIKDVNDRLREDYTIWLNGIYLTTSGLDVAVTSGEVMHIHETTNFPALNTATGDTMIDEFYNVYTQIDNTNYDDGAGGDTIIGNNKFHKTFIWGDIYGGLHMSRQRKPTTSEYTSFEQAISDPDHVAINAIPTEWEYVGFPIAHIILNEASGVIEIIDLRSGGVAGVGGGGGHAQNTDIGTDNDVFTLDTDNTATDISLIFGSTLNETLTWDGINTRFTFSDDLRIEGNNSVLGELYVAGDHTATDSDGIFNLGRNGSTWENIMWDDSDDQFEISDDLSFGQNQLKDVVIDNLASAPLTPVAGQIYHNTADGNTYIYNGTSWEDITATGSGTSSSDGWHGSTTRIKITPADFQSDDADDNMDMDQDGSHISETGTASPVVTMAIPTGYRATHVMIYGSDTGNAVNVYVNEIDDNSTATSLGTGNIGTELDITDTDSTALNYISIYINVGNNDQIYGGYITITAIP